MKRWSVGDLHVFVSSISTIHNVFYIINNWERDGVRKFLDHPDYSIQDAIQFFPKLDNFLSDNEKLMIDHIEMGSPDEFEVLTSDSKTGEDTKQLLKGDINVENRISNSDVGYNLRDRMKGALSKAIEVINGFQKQEKLARVT